MPRPVVCYASTNSRDHCACVRSGPVRSDAVRGRLAILNALVGGAGWLLMGGSNTRYPDISSTLAQAFWSPGDFCDLPVRWTGGIGDDSSDSQNRF